MMYMIFIIDHIACNSDWKL